MVFTVIHFAEKVTINLMNIVNKTFTNTYIYEGYSYSIFLQNSYQINSIICIFVMILYYYWNSYLNQRDTYLIFCCSRPFLSSLWSCSTLFFSSSDPCMSPSSNNLKRVYITIRNDQLSHIQSNFVIST